MTYIDDEGGCPDYGRRGGEILYCDLLEGHSGKHFDGEEGVEW